jgi:hypothetical protein
METKLEYREKKTPPPRSAAEVIDQAVRENRLSENFLYLIALLVVSIGSLALVYGVFSK